MHTSGYLHNTVGALANDTEYLQQLETSFGLDINELLQRPKHAVGATAVHEIALDLMVINNDSYSNGDSRNLSLGGPELLLDTYWNVSAGVNIDPNDLPAYVTGRKEFPVNLSISATEANPNCRAELFEEYTVTPTGVEREDVDRKTSFLNHEESLGLYTDLRIAIAAHKLLKARVN